MLRAYERYLALRQDRDDPGLAEDGLPVPPPRLRVLVVGHADRAAFLTSGRAEAGIVGDAFARAGTPVQAMGSLLDWGCGCGRLLRHWHALDGVAVSGCDYNPELVAWVRANLPFATVVENGLEPPLPYPAERFGGAYALSIFTHLTDRLVADWLSAVHRVLRPGGLFFFTAHGEQYRNRLSAEEDATFAAGRPVVQFASIEGTNLCAAYHPRPWMEQAVRHAGLEVLEVGEAHRLSDSERGVLSQDRYVVRRPL